MQMSLLTTLVVICTLSLSQLAYSADVKQGNTIDYSVKRHDTYYSIAKKFDVKLQEIYDANSLNSASKTPDLFSGMVLKIPQKKLAAPVVVSNTPIQYTIKRSDTLYAISKKFNIPLSEIIAHNKIDSVLSIKPGDLVLIPRKKDYMVNDAINSLSSNTKLNNSKEGVNASPKLESKSITENSNRKYPCGHIVFQYPIAKYNIIQKYLASKKKIDSEGIILQSVVEADGTQQSDVYASADGIVIYSGDELAEYGNLVILQHDKNGWFSIYARLGGTSVKEGHKVRTGDALGKLSSPDSSFLFIIRKVKQSYDPVLCMT